MKRFIIPAFGVVSAVSQDAAEEAFSELQGLSIRMPIALYQDEALPTVEISTEPEEHHTMLDYIRLPERRCADQALPQDVAPERVRAVPDYDGSVWIEVDGHPAFTLDLALADEYRSAESYPVETLNGGLAVRFPFGAHYLRRPNAT